MTKSLLLILFLFLFALGITSVDSQTLDKKSAPSEKETVELKPAEPPSGVEVTLTPEPEEEKKPSPEAEEGGSKQWIIVTVLAVLYLILRVSIRRKS